MTGVQTCALPIFFYTGIKRRASDVLADQKSALEKGDREVAETLGVIKAIGMEIRDALVAGDLDRFGWLLDQHWQVKKSLSDKVSSTQLDCWYETAKANGALGGKVMGAGGGGFFMFYCPNGSKARLRQALGAEGLKELRLGIDFEGSKVLMNF